MKSTPAPNGSNLTLPGMRAPAACRQAARANDRPAFRAECTRRPVAAQKE